MNQAITKNLHCVLLRNGIEIWLDIDRANTMKRLMETVKHIELEGSVFAVTEISGIFTPAHMEEYLHKKEGKWRCIVGGWHDKWQKCDCKRIIGYNKRFLGGEEIQVPVYEGGKLDV